MFALTTPVYTGNDFEYYSFADAADAQAFDLYLSACASRALYDTGVTAAYGDHLLALCTCSIRRTTNGCWWWQSVSTHKEDKMAYVPVPKDMNAVKTKVVFNLTKRQIICFGAGLLVGLPLFFSTKALWAAVRRH